MYLSVKKISLGLGLFFQLILLWSTSVTPVALSEMPGRAAVLTVAHRSAATTRKFFPVASQASSHFSLFLLQEPLEYVFHNKQTTEWLSRASTKKG